MGYENPNIVKEVYLTSPNGTMTRDEYFKKYGIDIQELFYVDSGVITPKQLAKFYGVFTNNENIGIKNIVLPVIDFIDDGGWITLGFNTSTTVYLYIAFDENGEIGIISSVEPS